MSPGLSNVPTPGTTTESSNLATVATVATVASEYKDVKVLETQGHQTRHMPNDAMAGCSSTKDRTISDFSVKVTGVSETGIADAGKKKHQCSQCGKVLKSTMYLKQHIQNMHEMKQRIKCPDCTKTFKNNRSLKRHRVNKHSDHKKKHECNQCKKAFSTSSDLKRHTSTVHTTEPRKECPDCAKTFKSRDALNQHRKREHTENGMPYKCNQCNRGFTHPSILKLHEVMHTKKRNYKCPDCHKSYYRASELNRHKLIKHGNREKTFICIECGASFLYPGNLRKHRLSHTAESTVQKSFECQICKKQFPGRFSLVQHSQIHNKNHLKYDRCSRTFTNKKNPDHRKRMNVNKNNYDHPICNARSASKRGLEPYTPQKHADSQVK